MENYDFIRALTSVREFTWHVFCDHYLEAIKYRLSGDQGRRAAQYALYKVLLRIITLLAPFTPHLCEEIYQRLFAKHEKWRSITIAQWPEAGKVDEEAVEKGEVLIRTIAALRHVKSKMRIPLNFAVKKVTLYAPKHYDILNANFEDVKNTIRIEQLEIKAEGKGEHAVEEYPEITFDFSP